MAGSGTQLLAGLGEGDQVGPSVRGVPATADQAAGPAARRGATSWLCDRVPAQHPAGVARVPGRARAGQGRRAQGATEDEADQRRRGGAHPRSCECVGGEVGEQPQPQRLVVDDGVCRSGLGAGERGEVGGGEVVDVHQLHQFRPRPMQRNRPLRACSTKRTRTAVLLQLGAGGVRIVDGDDDQSALFRLTDRAWLNEGVGVCGPQQAAATDRRGASSSAPPWRQARSAHGGHAGTSAVRVPPPTSSTTSASVLSAPTFPANTTYGAPITSGAASTGRNTDTSPGKS